MLVRGSVTDLCPCNAQLHFLDLDNISRMNTAWLDLEVSDLQAHARLAQLYIKVLLLQRTQEG